MRAAVQDWLQFISAEAHVLTRAPALLFQQAANQAAHTAPAQRARGWILQGRARRPWLEWVGKPIARPACRLTLVGHTDFVEDCALSPTGDRVVSASWDGTLRLWRLRDGRELAVLCGHANRVVACAFSPGGQLIASASWDQTLRLWDGETGAPLRVLEGHTHQVRCCAFSPDGSCLASGGDDGVLRLWDTTTGSCLAVAHSTDATQAAGGYVPSVRCVSWSPDGRQVAWGAAGIRVWDVPAGGPRRYRSRNPHAREPEYEVLAWHGEPGGVTACGFSPDGAILVSAGGTTVEVSDPIEGGGRTLTGHEDTVEAIAISPDGRTLASASRDATVRLWDLGSGELRGTAEGHANRVNACGFTPDGRRLVTASYDTTVRIWDVYGESPHTSPERAVLQGHTEWVWTVAVSSDGGMAVSASRDGTLRVWDIEAAVATPPEARHQHTVIQVIFSTDGQRVASGSLDGTVRIWDGSTGNALPVLERHEASVTACAFVPRSRQVATGCDDGSVHLWDAESGTVRWSRSPMAEDPEWHGYEPAVWALRVTRDGGAVLTAHNDGRVRIWDALDGILRADLQASETRSVALFCEVSPDDHHVLTWVQGVEPPLLWSLDKAEVVARLEGHTNWALWGGFSPDGTRIAITDSGGVLRLWDGRSGAAVSILEGHSKGMACAFSPDGHRLASASADGTIRLWDAVTGQALRAVSVEHPLGFVAYSADGSLLATLADTGWLDVWNAESLDLVCRYPGSATAMAWSPTEGTLALGAADGRFVLLRPDQGLPHPARTAAGNDAS